MISRARTFSSVLPAITECAPHELLPIIPPSVQGLWVDGSGAKVSPWRSAADRSESQTTPGSTSAVFDVGSISTMRSQDADRSKTTASLTVWPLIDVPA